jgi:hypothetical protein
MKLEKNINAQAHSYMKVTTGDFPILVTARIAAGLD